MANPIIDKLSILQFIDKVQLFTVIVIFILLIAIVVNLYFNNRTKLKETIIDEYVDRCKKIFLEISTEDHFNEYKSDIIHLMNWLVEIDVFYRKDVDTHFKFHKTKSNNLIRSLVRNKLVIKESKDGIFNTYYKVNKPVLFAALVATGSMIVDLNKPTCKLIMALDQLNKHLLISTNESLCNNKPVDIYKNTQTLK